MVLDVNQEPVHLNVLKILIALYLKKLVFLVRANNVQLQATAHIFQLQKSAV